MDAKDILLREHGSYKDALQKALAKNEPNWKGPETKKIGGIELKVGGAALKTKPKYSPNKPQGVGEELPTDRSALVKGTVYKTPKGNLEFTGSGFRKPTIDTAGE